MVMLICFSVDVCATQSRTGNFDKTYSLGANQAENIVNVALKQLGKSKANLGYTEAWCADFVCDCAKLTGMADNIIPYNYGSRGACTYLYNYMIQNCSAQSVSSRQKGDIIFYYCSACGRYVHTGIVLDETYTIEGNYDGKVTQVKNSYTDSAGHKLASGTIVRRYLRPNYSEIKPITETPSIWKSNDTCVVGDCVKFNWNSVENATGYWFSIWYKGEQIVTTQVSSNSEYTLYNLQEGEYTAFIKAYNETNSKENSVSLGVRYSTGEKTIANGKYQICSALDNAYVVSVASASQADEANVILYANEYHTNQIFDFEYLKNGYYKITAVHSGKCLDVYNNENKSGANVQQYRWDNNSNQNWIVREADDGYFYIISKGNGLYLDVYGGEAHNDANIDTYSGHGGSSEKWNLIPWIEGQNEIEDGIYTIQSVLDSNYKLNVAGKSKQDEANIQLGLENDAYRIKYQKDGSYSITNVNSGKNLDAYSSDTMKGKKKGTKVQQFYANGESNQKWIIRRGGDNWYYIICKSNGLYLDVYGGTAYNGANIDLWVDDGHTCQKWRFVPVSKEISQCECSLSEESYIYDKNEKKPYVTVKDGNDVLTENVDYNVTYSNNTNAGTATVAVKGIGKYTGTLTKHFTINKASQKLVLSIENTTLSIGESIQINVSGQGNIGYKSDAEDIVSISGTGLLTAKQSGTVVITVTAEGTENYNAAEEKIFINVLKNCLNEEHSWDDGTITIQPTCGKAGEKLYTCTACQATKVEELSATNNHVNTEVRDVKEATCTEDGYTGDMYCKDCGIKLSTGQTIHRLEHEWDDGKVTQAVTCTESGIKTYTCIRCNLIKTEEIIATGHQHTELRNVKEATCAQDGYTGDTYCKDCNAKLSSGKSVARKEHTWDAGVITKEATCNETGVKTYTCTGCQATKTESISATGHRNTELWNIEIATCTEEGYSGDLYCKDCNTLLRKGEVLAKKSHTWDKGIITAEATCTEKGSKTFSCTACGTTRQEDLPATDHKNKVVKFAKEASCKSEGYIGDVYCQDCGTLLEEGSVIPKTDHSWNSGEITQNATCTEEGIKSFTCTSCGLTETEKIPATGHRTTEVRNAKNATCTEEGYTGDAYCTICNQKIGLGSIVAKTEHQWDGGQVTKQPTITETGVKTYICNSCGMVRTEAIEKIERQTATPGKSVKDKATNGIYKVLSDGVSVEFTKPAAKKATVRIPDVVTVDGIACKVTAISASAFKNNTTLKTVVIGNNVAVIGDNAFYGCKKLSKVTGGNNVAKIGNKAFASCGNLKSITIPRTVESIGKQALYNCKKLKTITIKTDKLSSKTIGTKAFAGTYKKAIVKVSGNQMKAYKKLLKSKGINSKAVYKK